MIGLETCATIKFLLHSTSRDNPENKQLVPRQQAFGWWSDNDHGCRDTLYMHIALFIVQLDRRTVLKERFSKACS